MPLAGIHDAAGTALTPTINTNPQWAQQGTHAALRVPKIKNPMHLMQGAFDNTTMTAAPDNQTLVDTVTASVISGRTDADTARYMADLRYRPVALWQAAERQLGAMAKDSEQQINNWFRTALTNSIPLKESVDFILAWHSEYPLAVPPSLIGHLQQLVRATPRAIGIINEADAALTDAACVVASELNHKLIIDPTLKNETNLFCGIGFVPHRDDETLVRIEPDIMQMHLLPRIEPDILLPPLGIEGATAFREALYMAIALLSEHYLPLSTPDDMADIAMMFAEEAEDDINLIHAFMDNKGMDKNDDNQISEAIDTLAEDGQLFFVEEIGGYEFHKEIFDDKVAAEAEWKPIKAAASLAELNARIGALPATDDEKLTRLKGWLTGLADALKQRMNDPEHTLWHITLAEITHQDDSMLHTLIERNIIMTEDYTGLYAEAEQRHQLQMQDCDDDPIRLKPDANPKTVLRFCQQMREGTEWLARLHVALNSEVLV